MLVSQFCSIKVSDNFATDDRDVSSLKGMDVNNELQYRSKVS